ncbi:MAG: DUF853 family protein [Bacilli bacterium]|nr:DUF853 family protein [Bacilli bacterium]
MYINDKILIGKNNEYDAYLLPKMANRHGIISGASGSGKTVTVKVLAEGFSSASVPVFLVDVKGDLAGMAKVGTSNENIDKRVKELNIENFDFRNFNTIYWDVYGKKGHPIRTTVSKLGYSLLSKMLGLSDVQEGVLAIIFKIAEDENLELVDLSDLRSMITYVGEKRSEYSLNYGNITAQSLGGIGRCLLELESQHGEHFFGKPDFDINDFIKYDEISGNGVINILDATTLFSEPTLYATFMLWLLNSFYHTLPEVGDLEKPKIVFFFDEAHLMFSEMPNHMIKQIVQIVKLIRSKGVGLYFISQSPSDIPDEILSQLGNKIQHTLRFYTKSDEKAIKCAADSFRINPKFNTSNVIKELKTGEALVSLQNEDGQPSIVERVTILPPQSCMGTITDLERDGFIRVSPYYGKYENKIDVNSAFEKISQQREKSATGFVAPTLNRDGFIKKDVKDEPKIIPKKERKKKKSVAEKAASKLANQTINTIGRKLGNSIFNKLFK